MARHSLALGVFASLWVANPLKGRLWLSAAACLRRKAQPRVTRPSGYSRPRSDPCRPSADSRRCGSPRRRKGGGRNTTLIEFQRADRGAEPKRARYNSALMDANALKVGEDVDKLRDTYVIFITQDDVMGGGKEIYQIDRQIRELKCKTFQEFRRREARHVQSN